MTISTTTFNVVNTGTNPNDGTGDGFRDAFIKLNGNFSNINSVGVTVANLSITGNAAFENTYVPSSNSSTGSAGQVAWDSGYVYICVAANTWKRASLSTW